MINTKIEMLIAASRYDHAESECRRALAEDPDDVYLLCLLGVCVRSQSRPKEAEAVSYTHLTLPTICSV